MFKTKKTVKCEICGKEEKHSIFSFSFMNQWDSFKFWEKMNWRDFTIILLQFETNSYSKFLEIDFAIFGLYFTFHIDRCLSINYKCADCLKKIVKRKL